MAQVHAFASSRPSFTVPVIRRAAVAGHGPAHGHADDGSSSPATGIVIAAALGAAMWYGLALLVL
ncbi:hypothetical protein KRR38_02340 [Novosphingobium sp. G106]|uniref:hypothetical protein n=1 Tax=Novosphingobium sp. G106 TaxID=2849500 RepID=UPI001C2D0388|nr:hypothetical protein [Novosphingobium sp. G106]MBV1686535.1 hypothetical protein [Novosphingobium sp. G106]